MCVTLEFMIFHYLTRRNRYMNCCYKRIYVGKEPLTCTILAKNTIKCADNTTKWYIDEPL